MEGKGVGFWRAVEVQIGAIVGVGIFGLPYVFSEAGVIYGLIHLIALAIVSGILMSAYAELILLEKGKARLAAVIERHAGLISSRLATLILFGGLWGALLAYIIVGGTFAHNLLSPLISGSLMFYQLAFFVIGSAMLFLGLQLLARVEMWLVIALLVLLSIMILASLPYLNIDYAMATAPEFALRPFGVVLFALSGLGIVPEMADLLGKKKQAHLASAVAMGMLCIAMIYGVFAVVIASVSGPGTSSEAIVGLAQIVGDWVLPVGSLIGLFCVFSSFLMVGTEIVNTMVFDFKVRYLQAISIAILPPFLIYLVGARDFISVVGVVGGVLSASLGIIVAVTYALAHHDTHTPKRTLTMPIWVVGFAAIILTLGFMETIVSRL